MDGTLEIGTLLPWTLDGEMLMNLAGGTNASVSGQRIISNGLISVRSQGTLLASVHMMPGAVMHTIDGASRISLEHPTGNRMWDGSVTGAGMLHIAPNSNLMGTGLIQTGTEIDGVLRAENGTLVLTQPPSRIHEIGTRGEESLLLIPDGWSTLDGTLRLRQGTVAGGPIINTGSTTGYGIIAAASFENPGRLAPGPVSGAGDGSQGPGRLWFTQDLVQTSDGLISMDIGGVLHPDLRDAILVAGTIELAGTLQLQLTEGYIPQEGDAMIIMAWGNRIGMFDEIEGSSLPGALRWDVTYMPDHLIITAVPGCAGDVTGDGDVGLADMLELLAQWGPCAGACTADLNDDGTVDLTDLLIVLSAWGPCP